MAESLCDIIKCICKRFVFIKGIVDQQTCVLCVPYSRVKRNHAEQRERYGINNGK